MADGREGDWQQPVQTYQRSWRGGSVMATTGVLYGDRSVGQNPSYCGKVGTEAVGNQSQRRRLPARRSYSSGGA